MTNNVAHEAVSCVEMVADCVPAAAQLKVSLTSHPSVHRCQHLFPSPLAACSALEPP